MSRVTKYASACVLAAGVGLASSGAALAQDGVSFTLGFGGQVQPKYFGSDSYQIGPTGSFSLQRFSLGSLQFGSSEPGSERLGFGLRGAFGVIGSRKAKDNPELTGLRDVKTAVEVGFGLGYEAEDWRAFADLRYGAVGHKSTVAELGADWKVVNTPDLKLSVGPRLLYGSDRYMRTYFGVTPAEAAASTTGLTAFAPSSGLVSSGVELEAEYSLGNDWALVGSLAYNRLRGDAARSPITRQGSRDQGSVSLMLTRRFSLGF